MLERQKLRRDAVEFVNTDLLVPQNHLPRKSDSAVDFCHNYNFVEDLYCEDNGCSCVEPVVLFKIVLIQHLHGIPSLCRTAQEINMNIAHRWFLGYMRNEELPHFSTRRISAKRVSDDKRVLPTAYKRPMTKEGNLEWWEYVYDE